MLARLMDKRKLELLNGLKSFNSKEILDFLFEYFLGINYYHLSPLIIA